MKKKIVSVLLCTAMAVTLLAGCGKKEEAATTETPVESTEAATAEEIPTPVYYYSFDEADDNDSIKVAVQDSSATPIVQTTDDAKTYIPGVKGEAIYTNGVNGIKLTDVNGVGDTYTVSFWIYATRFANYMPTVQFGPDVHGDATGNQHYLNITRAEWNQDGAAFPCIWAYDQADDGLWPAWAPSGADEHLKEWMNITLVVDANNVSTDGTMLVANLYVNGEEVVEKDSDGNVIPINVVNGCMAQSDNFDFLVGINYWDAVFKGAFDELYIFDQALTPGQALALYQMGDPTVAYEEPERVVEVVASEDALYTLGTTDLTAPFWSDWTATTEIKDGETKEIVLKNYSDGINAWDNFVTVFTNEPSDAHVDPNSVATDKHVEWAVTRADLFSWGIDNDTECEYSWSWGNWDTWRTSVMVDSDVTMTINRSGSDLTINYNFVDYNGTDNTATAILHTALTESDPCYFLFTNEASYVEIKSIKDAIVIVPDENAIASVGSVDFTNAWWTDWSETTELADGATKTVQLKNYSDGVNNWDNYVIGFINEKNEAGVDPNTISDSHVEYAMLRADAYGWGDAEFAYETSWGDDWATWLSAMKAADVTLEISRDGNVITVDATIVDREGNTLTSTSTVTSNLLGSEECHFFITCEECYIDILSIQ
ncbi:MAG: LamG-like jellyroll fold domain-containing protein [Agathobacter sp.]